MGLPASNRRGYVLGVSGQNWGGGWKMRACSYPSVGRRCPKSRVESRGDLARPGSAERAAQWSRKKNATQQEEESRAGAGTPAWYGGSDGFPGGSPGYAPCQRKARAEEGLCYTCMQTASQPPILQRVHIGAYRVFFGQYLKFFILALHQQQET